MKTLVLSAALALGFSAFAHEHGPNAIDYGSCADAQAYIQAHGQAIIDFPDGTYQLINNGNRAFCPDNEGNDQPYFYHNCMVGYECEDDAGN